MSRKPTKTKPIKHGKCLKLRHDKDGLPHPRWEATPQMRKIGLKGRDLKDIGGNWLDAGMAINVADKRTEWARNIIAAMRGNKIIADTLSQAITMLPPATTETAALVQYLMSDIFELVANLSLTDWGKGLVETPIKSGLRLYHIFDNPADVPIQTRTVSLALDMWFKDPQTKKNKSQNTLRQYENNIKRIKADIGERHINQITPLEARKIIEDIENKRSLGMAHHFAAILSPTWEWMILNKWAIQNPWVKLKLKKPAGRIIVWQPHETENFAKWCDDNGFADIADAIIMMEWSGHNPVDYCNATLDDFADVWDFNRQKTAVAAMVGITPQMRERINLRKNRDYGNVKFTHNYFAVNMADGTRFDTTSLRERFNDARKKAIKQNPDFASIKGLHLQDLRDTCITRLHAAGIPISRMCQWTGHSEKTAEQIIKAHYAKPLKITALETSRDLVAFTERLRLFNQNSD